jgi:hypothetical protein
MNYKITFSTYVNATGEHTPKARLLHDLVELSNIHKIQGWNLSASDGYYAGELELSYSLTVYDIEPLQAETLALAIKAQYNQLEVILEKLPNTDVRFI